MIPEMLDWILLLLKVAVQLSPLVLIEVAPLIVIAILIGWDDE